MTRPLSLVISIASISLAVLTPVRAHAESKLCFDMNQPIKTPLKSPISAKAGRDASDSGAFGKKGVWGAARGSVKQPIQEVFQKLLDHYTIKDPEKVKLKVYDQEQNGFMAFHVVMVEAHPLPMVSVDWEENWAYVLTDGTPASPKKIVISYQKAQGTSYIPHLCGSIVLTSETPDSTDVSLYEEIEALGRRTAKQTVKGHLGTLETLRQKTPIVHPPVASN